MDNVFRIKLREELDFQDVRVKELAEKTHISQRTLEGYLSARASIPPADIAVTIANALNVTVEYLITGKEPDGQCSLKNSLLTEINALSTESLELVRDIVRVVSKYDELKKKKKTILIQTE